MGIKCNKMENKKHNKRFKYAFPFNMCLVIETGEKVVYLPSRRVKYQNQSKNFSSNPLKYFHYVTG